MLVHVVIHKEVGLIGVFATPQDWQDYIKRNDLHIDEQDYDFHQVGVQVGG